MKIEIKLKDPKYCNGCWLIYENYGYFCCLNYWNTYFDSIDEKIKRPQECIDKHGE